MGCCFSWMQVSCLGGDAEAEGGVDEQGHLCRKTPRQCGLVQSAPLSGRHSC